MEWNELYGKDVMPSMEQIREHIGKAAGLWQELLDYMEAAYKTKPKLTYSACSGKPGWNVKLQKSGTAFGTFYPERDGFSVLFVLSYRLSDGMQAILSLLSDDMAEMYREAPDYMKMGKWLMFPMDSAQRLEDYKKIMAVKMPPKA